MDPKETIHHYFTNVRDHLRELKASGALSDTSAIPGIMYASQFVRGDENGTKITPDYDKIIAHEFAPNISLASLESLDRLTIDEQFFALFKFIIFIGRIFAFDATDERTIHIMPIFELSRNIHIAVDARPTEEKPAECDRSCLDYHDLAKVIEQLRTEIERMTNRNSCLVFDATDLDRRLTDVRKEKQAIMEENATHKAELARFETDSVLKTAHERKMHEMQAEIETLRATIGRLETDLGNERKTSARLNGILANIRKISFEMIESNLQ